ncbi:MAG TPA: hypothetical protein PK198_14170 [Saprospiraceae bacterium]|nr:hypothetical protein [Saprospiraceae bacterium]HRK80217.1 hypothetical protein [Saprospiraceae bacterium]
MDIKTIQNQLTEKHQLFSDFVGSLSSDEFSFRKSDKWTAGEQLEHILLSVRPLRQALSLPKFMLKLIWGQSNRAGRDYEGLVNKYLSKLESGGRATGRFIPKAVQETESAGRSTMSCAGYAPALTVLRKKNSISMFCLIHCWANSPCAR